MRRLLLLLIPIVLGASACDPTWEDMTMWSYGVRCDRPILVGVHLGDFTWPQAAAVADSVREWAAAGRTDVRYVGAVSQTAQENTVDNLIVVERRPVVSKLGAQYIGYGWPGIDPRTAQIPYRGVVWLSPIIDPLPIDRWRMHALHELGHAIYGLGDRYDNDDGHPELVMGSGGWTISALGVGDVLGAQAKGCHLP